MFVDCFRSRNLCSINIFQASHLDPLKVHILTLQVPPEPTVTPLQLKNPDPDSTVSSPFTKKPRLAVLLLLLLWCMLLCMLQGGQTTTTESWILKMIFNGNGLDYRQRQLVGGGNSNIFYFQPYLRKIPILAI